jgi:hypothetical protein
LMSASLIGRLGSSAFDSVDVAHGLVLLSGIGTKALPSWDSKTRWKEPIVAGWSVLNQHGGR